MKIIHRLTLAVLLLSCSGLIKAEEPTEPSEQQKIDAVSLVRWLNTSELKYKANFKTFASLEELVSSGVLKETKNSANLGTEELNYAVPDHLLPGFSIRVTTSRDGNKYQISLVDDVHENHWALFSSDKGLIFEGRPI